MPEPFVSIVIPCYNAAHFIDVAIRSALSQDCPVQIVVIDDGSTDDSAAIAQQFEPDIQLLRTSNRGVAYARSAAISLLSAPYTLLLDADDRLADGALKSLVSAMHGMHDRVIYGRFQCWDEDMSTQLSLSTFRTLKPHPFHCLSAHDFTPPGAVLFPTHAFEKIGGFDQAVAGCEDWDFLVRLARLGLKFQGIRNLVFHYRRVTSSASNQPLKMLKAGLEVIRRAHTVDERVQGDTFPEGMNDDELPQKLFVYGADCFALASVRKDVETMDQVFNNIPVPGKPSWKAFALMFRREMSWHRQPYQSEAEGSERDGLLCGADYLIQHVTAFQQNANLVKALLYPDMMPLLKRPGPKKALRLFREWREARSRMASLDPTNSTMNRIVRP